MRERPILFSGPLVRAILDGSKTQTRRPMRIDDSPVPIERDVDFKRWRGTAKGIPTDASNVRMCGPYAKCDAPPGSTTVSSRVLCPYGEPGDRLYVKEAWRSPADWDHEPPRNLRPYEPILYLADAEKQEDKVGHADLGWGRYRHARFMPRALSRITLEVTGVGVERVQDITVDDARAEGMTTSTLRGRPLKITGPGDAEPREGVMTSSAPDYAFAVLWEDVYGARGLGWQANPWVWVVDFRRMEATS